MENGLVFLKNIREYRTAYVATLENGFVNYVQTNFDEIKKGNIFKLRETTGEMVENGALFIAMADCSNGIVSIKRVDNTSENIINYLKTEETKISYCKIGIFKYNESKTNIYLHKEKVNFDDIKAYDLFVAYKKDGTAIWDKKGGFCWRIAIDSYNKETNTVTYRGWNSFCTENNLDTNADKMNWQNTIKTAQTFKKKQYMLCTFGKCHINNYPNYWWSAESINFDEIKENDVIKVDGELKIAKLDITDNIMTLQSWISYCYKHDLTSDEKLFSWFEYRNLIDNNSKVGKDIKGIKLSEVNNSDKLKQLLKDFNALKIPTSELKLKKINSIDCISRENFLRCKAIANDH